MSSSLITALQNPACYPHTVSTPIQVIETQVSWLLLTGEFAYKLKKQLNFGFLDFSTLDKRQFYCEEELRLNQRLAPDIYQCVVAIKGSIEQPQITSEDHRKRNEQCQDETSEVLEYAVRMQQFDPQCGLDQLLKQNRFASGWIDQLAEHIAKFHLILPTVTYNSPWGESENIWQLVSDNYLHTLDYCSDPEDLQQLQSLYQQTTEDYSALTEIFKERRKLGFVRECHGDLHLGNVTFHEDKFASV